MIRELFTIHADLETYTEPPTTTAELGQALSDALNDVVRDNGRVVHNLAVHHTAGAPTDPTPPPADAPAVEPAP